VRMLREGDESLAIPIAGRQVLVQLENLRYVLILYVFSVSWSSKHIIIL
jgi:hypothetical protein